VVLRQGGHKTSNKFPIDRSSYRFTVFVIALVDVSQIYLADTCQIYLADILSIHRDIFSPLNVPTDLTYPCKTMSLSAVKKAEVRRYIPIEIDVILSWIRSLYHSLPEIERIEFRVTGKNVKGLDRRFEKNADGYFRLIESK
jgi:hypothetical protein